MSSVHVFGKGWPFTRRIKYAGVARMLLGRMSKRRGENKKGRLKEKKDMGGWLDGRDPGMLGLLTISRAHEGGRKAAR